MHFYLVLQFINNFYTLFNLILCLLCLLEFIIHILFKSTIIRPSTYQMIQKIRVIFINQFPPILYFIIVQQFSSLFPAHAHNNSSIIVFFMLSILTSISFTNVLAHLSFLHLGLSKINVLFLEPKSFDFPIVRFHWQPILGFYLSEYFSLIPFSIMYSIYSLLFFLLPLNFADFSTVSHCRG